jgi:hypothetical protein
MSIDETARALMSGEHSRRRGYLTNVITSFNGLAIMGTLSIWAFFVKWELLLGDNPSPEMFSTEVAWASSISSILIGLWRLYVRFLDGAIIQLYPAIYICERALIPEEICTMKSPNKIKSISRVKNYENLDWVTVCYKDFGGRGHHLIDSIAFFFVVLFGMISIIVAYKQKVITIDWFGSPHLIGWLLIGNLIGLLLILVSWLQWRKRQVKWPIPKDCSKLQEKSTAEPVNSADPKGRAAD